MVSARKIKNFAQKIKKTKCNEQNFSTQKTLCQLQGT